MSEPVSEEYLEVLTKAFQDSIEGVIVIGSSVVEVEVDGETKYKVVFELEATEETVEAAQEEEEITRINNSLVLPVSCGNLKTSPIKRPRVRQDETHIIVQGTRHVLSRRPCIYTGGKIEDAKDFCLNRLAVFRPARARGFPGE